MAAKTEKDLTTRQVSDATGIRRTSIPYYAAMAGVRRIRLDVVRGHAVAYWPASLVTAIKRDLGQRRKELEAIR